MSPTDCGTSGERIRLEADEVRKLGACSYVEIAKRPALCALLQSAMAAIENAIPATLEHEGETYFLCVRIAQAELGIHSTHSEATPLVHVMAAGGRWAGHRPGH